MAIPSGSTNNWLSNNSSYPGSGTTVFDAGSYNQNLTVNLTGTTYDPTNYSFTFNDTANAQLYSQTYGGGFTDLINYRTALTWHIWFENLELINVGNSMCWMGTRAAGDFYGFGFSKNTSNKLAMDVAYGVTVATTANIQSGWHLASIAWSSASGTFDIYVDGVLDVSNYTGNLFAAGSIISTDAIYFGHSPLSGYAEYWNGRIGQSTLYPTKQNAGQVLAFYNSTFGRFTPAVHAYDAADPASYPGSGSTLFDVGTGTAADLTITNATYDNVNDSFALDGTNTSHIRSAYPVTIGIGANNFTTQYWFKYNGITSQPPYNIFLQVGTRGPGGAFNGFNHNTYNNQFIFEQPGVGNYSTGFYPTVDQWYQITQTLDSSNNLEIFVDGTSVYSTTISPLTAPTGSFTQIAWGTATFSSDSVGNVDAGPLFIYDRVLSNTEITDYYNSTVTRFFPPPPPPIPGLVGGRTFGQGFAG